MKITIQIVGTSETVAASIDDTAAGRDFVALLPLELTLSDHARTEKVSPLPGPLSTSGAPDGYEPHIGDLAWYAPWGNIAIYYRDFAWSKGLVKLGFVDNGLAALVRDAPFVVRIVRVDQAR